METFFTGSESSSQVTFYGGDDSHAIAPPVDAFEAKNEDPSGRPAKESGVRRIIRNFTPS
jgi:hypothetical protein